MPVLFKALFLVIVFSIFEFSLEYNNIEFVSPILKRDRTDPSRFSFGGKSYYIQSVFMANFYRAIQFCRQQKMQLLSITNQLENDKIGKVVLDNGLAHGHFWTSASNLAGNGQWVWLSTGRNIIYTNWYPGEPTGNSGKARNNETENCIEVRHGGWSGFTWNDIPCQNEAWFICESSSDCD